MSCESDMLQTLALICCRSTLLKDWKPSCSSRAVRSMCLLVRSLSEAQEIRLMLVTLRRKQLKCSVALEWVPCPMRLDALMLVWIQEELYDVDACEDGT